jgi:hypothetical protein
MYTYNTYKFIVRSIVKQVQIIIKSIIFKNINNLVSPTLFPAKGHHNLHHQMRRNLLFKRHINNI